MPSNASDQSRVRSPLRSAVSRSTSRRGARASSASGRSHLLLGRQRVICRKLLILLGARSLEQNWEAQGKLGSPPGADDPQGAQRHSIVCQQSAYERRAGGRGPGHGAHGRRRAKWGGSARSRARPPLPSREIFGATERRRAWARYSWYGLGEITHRRGCGRGFPRDLKSAPGVMPATPQNIVG